MRKVLVLCFLFGSVAVSKELELPGKCTSVESRAFTQTREIKVPAANEWTVTAKDRGGVNCQAERKLSSGDTLVLIYSPASKDRWFFSITTTAKTAAKPQSPAKLLIDGGAGPTGLALALTDPGVSRVRAEFADLGISAEKLKTAKRLQLSAPEVLKAPLTLPLLNDAITALESCYKEATGPNKDQFWKAAQSGCG